jgi:hypothetical protein
VKYLAFVILSSIGVGAKVDGSFRNELKLPVVADVSSLPWRLAFEMVLILTGGDRRGGRVGSSLCVRGKSCMFSTSNTWTEQGMVLVISAVYVTMQLYQNHR